MPAEIGNEDRVAFALQVAGQIDELLAVPLVAVQKDDRNDLFAVFLFLGNWAWEEGRAENHAILGQQIAPPELDRSGHFLGLRISFRRLILGAGTAGSTQQNQGRKDQEQAHRFRPNPALHAASRSS